MRPPIPQLPLLGVVLSLLNVSTVLARPGTAADACKSIANSLNGKVSLPASDAYKDETSDYFNVAITELKPACVVFPTSATDVSSVVKALNQYDDVQFAVKSGGHDPNPGQASVDGGVLIALSHLNGTTYDKARGVALAKPGHRMDDIARALEPEGVTAVLGREGMLGSGGFFTQGGLSYLSTQYGLGCDNVVEYETVLANGSIVNINQESHPDLLQAMRGSGSQFGIVTQFTLRTYPIGKVWGGMTLYSADDKEAIFNAYHGFANRNMDPKAAMTFFLLRSVGGPAAFLITYFYDGPKPPKGAFGKLRDIKPMVDLTTQQTYKEIISTNTDPKIDLGSILGLTKNTKRSLINIDGNREAFHSISIPYVSSRPDVYSKIDAAWANITSKHLGFDPTFLTSVVFQPVPNLIGKESDARGGNAMGLHGTDHDRIVLEIQAMYQRREDDAKIPAMYAELHEQVAQLIAEVKQSANTQGIQVGEYNPTYMNDAGVNQDVTSSYRDAAKFAKLQVEVDPNGLFSKKAGGFKYVQQKSG